MKETFYRKFNLFPSIVKIEKTLCLSLLMICDLVYGGINERHLINHLLNNYNPLERPVENENDTLNVIFGITLQQIIDVDEKNQILISNLWLKFVCIQSINILIIYLFCNTYLIFFQSNGLI